MPQAQAELFRSSSLLEQYPAAACCGSWVATPAAAATAAGTMPPPLPCGALLCPAPHSCAPSCLQPYHMVLRATLHASPSLPPSPLQRAENWLGAVVVPRSQLVSNSGEFFKAYATQLSILRSYTDGAHSSRQEGGVPLFLSGGGLTRTCHPAVHPAPKQPTWMLRKCRTGPSVAGRRGVCEARAEDSRAKARTSLPSC